MLLQNWVVLDGDNGLVIQCYTASADEHPKDVGVEWIEGVYRAVAIEHRELGTFIFDTDTDSWIENLAKAKAAKWEEVKAAKDASRYGGCMTPLGRMQSDEVSKNLLTSAVGLAGLLGEAFTINWTMEDNAVVTHDAGAINGAGIAMGIWYASRQDLAETLRAQISTATTVAEVEAVSWPL